MATSQLEQKLSEEFGDFGIDIDGNIPVLQKLSLLCNSSGLDAEGIVAKWVSFTMAKRFEMQDIDEESLEEFEKSLKKSDKPSAKKATPYRPKKLSVANTHNNIDGYQDDIEQNSMLESYATTPQGKESIKRQHTTPEERTFKRFAAVNSTPISQDFSPSSLASPAVNTPSLKYESRSGKGQVVQSFGIPDKTSFTWKGCRSDVTIKDFDSSSNVMKPYKHMFQKLQDKADVLNDMISTLTDQMKQAFNINDFENIWTQAQDDIPIAGRICCDSVGRLNSKSVVLEGSRETSAGQRLPVDLSQLKNYSLFPGQIVTMNAKNSTGSHILPSSVNMGIRLPFYSGSKKHAKVNEDNFSVYVSGGPYATCDDVLSYTPLVDLCNVIKNETPDIVIMLGPFVDSKQSLVERGEIDQTFDELFEYCKNTVNKAIRNIQTQVIFVPSYRDVFHEFVYPQPPFQSDKTSKIKMVSDPCTLLINDVVFGVTSTDVLFHLGAEEVSNVRSDRLARLANHLLLQQCYYPLHPVSEEINLDYEHFGDNCFMPVTPDVLIVPSDLRYFVKNIEGCMCLNPGRLVKGTTGGTFAKILVKPSITPNANISSAISKSIAQIVRL